MILDTHPGKQPIISHQGSRYKRHMVRTSLIESDTNLPAEILAASGDFLQEDDILCIAESVVAITQNRAYKISDIKPSPLAVLLSSYVRKTPAGIGLGMPETMQLAIQEVGRSRLIFAAAVAAITRICNRRGDFYRIAGEKARGIDGPTPGTLPPYNEYATLVPAKPRSYAIELEKYLFSRIGAHVQVIIVDANDIGVNILGARDSAQEALATSLCQDNPMGQGHEQTPVMICRKVS